MIILGIQSLQRFSMALTALPLIIPALFFLCFADRGKAAARGCDPVMMRCAGWLALLVLLFITAPVSSGIINSLLGSGSLTRCFLAAPVVLVSVYAATELMRYCGAAFGVPEQSARRRRALCACLAAVAFASVSVPWRFTLKDFSLIGNLQKINPDAYTISSVIGDDTALLPPEIKAQIGEFDSEVKTMNKSYYHEGSPLATAYSGAKTGCTYVVVSKKDSKPKQLSRYGYEKYKPAGAYVIYRRQP